MDRVPLMAHSKLASRPTGVETFAMGEIVISSIFSIFDFGLDPKKVEKVQIIPNRLKYTLLFLKKLFRPRRGHFLVWIFANLMKGGFDNGQSSETLGSLDMSGAQKVNCPLEFSKSVSWMKKVKLRL